MGFEQLGTGKQHSLITPSASPPSRFRSFSINPSANAIAIKGSSSFGSSSRSCSRFSSTPLSTDTHALDIPTLRSQSTSRLLSVWSTLADRYSLRVDEDDIVNIRTGQLVKDRGVVRALNGKWDFGRFAAAGDDDGDDQPDDDEVVRRETTEGADDESDDELDSFAYLDHQQGQQEEVQADIGATNPFIALSNLAARTTHAIDPTNDEDDAADLRAFLEAERLRRETQGDVDEEDENSGGDHGLEEEEGSELVSDFNTEETDGFTTEGEAFSDLGEVQIANKENIMEESCKQSSVAPEKEGSDDELESWDASDFDIVLSLSSDNSYGNKLSRSSPSEPTVNSLPHLLTPPDSSTYSESYTDTIEPLTSSPPSTSSTRRRLRPKLSSTEQESTAILKTSPPISSSSILSSNSFSSSSRIPRLDLSQLYNLRGRSQSRSPSKVDRQDNENTTRIAVAGAQKSSRSKTAKPELPRPRSVASSSSMSRIYDCSSLESTSTSSPPKSSVMYIEGHKGNSSIWSDEDDGSLHTANIKGRLNVPNVKGKGKAREIIEIDDSSDDFPEYSDHVSSPTRRGSSKTKGKKRRRSSGGSEEEWAKGNLRQVPEGSDTETRRKGKPMGSPTKKGRYTVQSETALDPARVPHTSSGSTSEVDSTMSSKNSPMNAKSYSRLPERMQRDNSFHRERRGSNVLIHEDDSDGYTKPKDAFRTSSRRPEGRSRSRVRTNSARALTDQRSDPQLVQSDIAFDMDDYSMHDPSPPRRDHFRRSYNSVSDGIGHPDPPPLTGGVTQLQIQKALEGRAKDIISNAIQGLYSLLTPEGMSAFQGQLQEQESMSPTHRYPVSQSSSTRETSAMVYTPRKISMNRRASDLASTRSIPFNASSYMTPTSHRDRIRQQPQSHPDPNFSRGTLPPSSPYPESDDQYHYDDIDGSDRHNLEDDERPTSLSPVTSYSSPIRRSGRRDSSNLSPRPRASSIVQRSRSRGRRVSFKEIASQTETKTGEIRRTLSREISVEDPRAEVYREGRRVEAPLDLHDKIEVDYDYIRDTDERTQRAGYQSRRRGSLRVPNLPTLPDEKSQLLLPPPSAVRAPTEPEPPKLLAQTQPRRRPGRSKNVNKDGERIRKG